MTGSDNSTRVGYVGHRQTGVGHYTAMKCVRCQSQTGTGADRHDWRGVKKAPFCAACSAWLKDRREARAA